MDCAQKMNHGADFLPALYDRFGNAPDQTSCRGDPGSVNERNLDVDGWGAVSPNRLPRNRKDTK
jgi:hypothetical protein